MSENPSTAMQTIDPETGEILSAEQALLRIAKRDTGGLGRAITTTIDVSTPEGQAHLQRHIDHDQGKDSKTNDGWYGKEFMCVAITSRGVMAKKSADGKALDVPKPLVRTTLETSDGKILALNSSYVFEDVMQIRAQCGEISRERPVCLKLKKGGAADRIVRVWEETPTNNHITSKPAKPNKAG